MSRNRITTSTLKRAGLVVIGAIIVGGCSSDATEVDTGGATTAVATTETQPTPTEASTVTTASTTTTEGLEPSTTSTTVDASTASTTRPIEVEDTVTVIGAFHLPEGEFVKITDGTIDDDVECQAGRLGVRSEGELMHVYDDIGDVLGLQIFDGPFGQTALVETCEESVIRLLFADTAMLPDDGVPELVEASLPSDVFFLSDLRWDLNGLFNARATFFDDTGWNDDVVFHGFDGSMQLLADAVGERSGIETDGVDFIIPTGWVFADGDPALDITTIVDTASPASLTITIYPEPIPTPDPIGDEQVASTAVDYVAFWDDLGDGRARTAGTGVEVTDHLFRSPEGDRLVRIIETDARTIEIQAFTPTSAGAPTYLVPNLVLDHVRVFTSVG